MEEAVKAKGWWAWLQPPPGQPQKSLCFLKEEVEPNPTRSPNLQSFLLALGASPTSHHGRGKAHHHRKYQKNTPAQRPR